GQRRGVARPLGRSPCLVVRILLRVVCVKSAAQDEIALRALKHMTRRVGIDGFTKRSRRET
ncbi:MAG: hypothetical protein JSV66_13420, partial [Trueperaceae bacterium]